MTRPDDRLTVSEVAALAGIKPATFRAYVARRQAPEPDGHLDGRTPFWYRSTVDGKWDTMKPHYQDVHCITCADGGRDVTCARLRCYCGHPTCWAFDSYVALKDTPAPIIPTAANTRQARSWADREEPTWLDR